MWEGQVLVEDWHIGELSHVGADCPGVDDGFCFMGGTPNFSSGLDGFISGIFSSILSDAHYQALAVI